MRAACVVGFVQMARQLSLGEEKLFQQVNHLEFLNKAWLAQNPEAGAPALSYAPPPTQRHWWWR
jgi:hypothetical protein